MIYTRIFNWREHLNAHIVEHKPKPFVWGEHDCCTWTASCIDLIYKEKRFDGLQASYNNISGAKSILTSKFDAKTVFEACGKIFGELKPRTFARCGDVVIGDPAMIEQNIANIFGPPVGICNGARSYFVSDKLYEIDTLKTLSCYHTHGVQNG